MPRPETSVALDYSNSKLEEGNGSKDDSSDTDAGTDSDSDTEGNNEDENDPIFKRETPSFEKSELESDFPPTTKNETPISKLPEPDPPSSLGKLPSHVEMEFSGEISSNGILDGLVVVKTQLGCSALQEDTTLWFSDREPLGKIFDVIGPVAQPFYTVRLPKSNEASFLSKIVKGTKVFYAKTEDTAFVITEELRRLFRGSDASWLNDEEPPADVIEYSDDEEEALAKKEKARKRKNVDGENN
eukprot:UC4_evm1s1503